MLISYSSPHGMFSILLIPAVHRTLSHTLWGSSCEIGSSTAQSFIKDSNFSLSDAYDIMLVHRAMKMLCQLLCFSLDLAVNVEQKY